MYRMRYISRLRASGAAAARRGTKQHDRGPRLKSTRGSDGETSETPRGRPAGLASARWSFPIRTPPLNMPIPSTQQIEGLTRCCPGIVILPAPRNPPRSVIGACRNACAACSSGWFVR